MSTKRGQISIYENVTPDVFLDIIKPRQLPAILKGVTAHWPATAAGQSSGSDLLAYLQAMHSGLDIPHFACPPEHNGRFFYQPGYTSFNYRAEQAPINTLFDTLRTAAKNDHPTAYFAGSLAVAAFFPAFAAANSLGNLIPASDILQSVWIGNRTLTAPHYDNLENIACVVAGRRKFTLFPIDQFANMYIGPLDLTPAGQPISLVDIRNPDYEAFPRYREAEAHALVATLEPGDAIYIPTMWWHGVESLDPINVMVNYWWRDVPGYFGSPMAALMHAALALRDLPAAQRARWKVVFDNLIFETNGPALDHLPAAARGVFGDLTRARAMQLRDLLAKSLSA